LYASTSDSAAASPVASLNAWTLDMSTDEVDTTCFEDGNQTSVLGFPAYKGTFSGFWDDTEDTLFSAQESSTGCYIYLYMSLDAVSKYFYGPAWVSASLDTGVKDAVKVSGTFSAKGSWGRK
jgi:hypothetical protein